MIESILLTAARVCIFEQQRLLTNASSFFFERDERLFLVTTRHVMIDEPSNHFPDRIEIELHIDPDNMAKSTGFSIPLYRNGKSTWRQGLDTAGEIDVAVIEIERSALPEPTVYRAFTPKHLLGTLDQLEIGTSLLVVGFPLGFHDTLHHMPVVRQAAIASSFGLRFQGHGYFLTDARTHRGTSGAPVVTRVSEREQMQGDLPWILLGVHSARLDVGTRDLKLDEALVADRSAPQKHVWRAKIILATADGCGTAEIMRRSGKSKPVVWTWQARFMAEGVEGLLRDKTRKPGKPPLPPTTVQRGVDLALGPPPGESPHWTGRELAKAESRRSTAPSPVCR